MGLNIFIFRLLSAV